MALFFEICYSIVNLIFILILIIVFYIVDYIASRTHITFNLDMLVICIYIFIYLITFIIGLFILAQSAKRLHDLDKSDWYLLIRLTALIPRIGWVILLAFELYLFLAKGTTGPNRFGPDPLGREAGDSNDSAQSLNSEVVDAEYEDIHDDEN